MTESGVGPPLRVDVTGLPGRVVRTLTAWERRAPVIQLAFGVVYTALVLAWSREQVVLVVVGLGQALLGLLGVLTYRRSHLVLEPEGVRRVGVLGRGRLTPWADVAEVRPPEAWHDVSHLRGHGRFPETTDLPGLTADHARELQRRLATAREGAVVRPEADGRGA